MRRGGGITEDCETITISSNFVESMKSRIGLLFTSQDRYDLARMALTTAIEGIDSGRFDVTLLWLDGSVTPKSLEFFADFSSERVRLIKESGFRNLGAARVIQLGMNRLQELGAFDWIGMLESDCFFTEDWLGAVLRAGEAAEADGHRVGGLTAESAGGGGSDRQYEITEVLCASNALFLPVAWQLVPPAAIAHNFPKKYFAGLCTIPMAHPSAELGWDWIFAMALDHGGGFEVITPPQPKAFNCGTPDSHKEMLAAMMPGEEPQTGRGRLPAEWEAAVRMCHAHSDAAILRGLDMREFSYLAVEFLPSWYAKEANDQSWWRWASGAADILVHNCAARGITCKLEFGSWSLDPLQIVKVSWNGGAIGEFCRGAQFCRQIEIPPGISVLRFEPCLPGQVPPLDPRRLAFSLVADRERMDFLR